MNETRVLALRLLLVCMLAMCTALVPLTASAVNPATTYGSWNCTYQETAAISFSEHKVYTSVSGTCADEIFTSGWWWHSGSGAYIWFGPEDWVILPGNLWFANATTTKMYGYGQIRDYQYMGGTDSPTLEAFAD